MKAKNQWACQERNVIDMANGALYVTGGRSLATTTGEIVPLGTVVRKFGNNISYGNGTIYLRDRGYYDIDAAFVIEPSAAGTVTVQMYKNGVPVQNAFASISVTTTDVVETICIPAIMRVRCNCDDPVEITYQVTSGTVEVLNASATVIKL